MITSVSVKWAATVAVYGKKVHPERLNKEMRENSEKFNWTGIVFPLSLDEIDKYEKQNDYGICVITYDEREGFGRVLAWDAFLMNSKFIIL